MGCTSTPVTRQESNYCLIIGCKSTSFKINKSENKPTHTTIIWDLRYLTPMMSLKFTNIKLAARFRILLESQISSTVHIYFLEGLKTPTVLPNVCVKFICPSVYSSSSVWCPGINFAQTCFMFRSLVKINFKVSLLLFNRPPISRALDWQLFLTFQ
jgi:hypothetical protein